MNDRVFHMWCMSACMCLYLVCVCVNAIQARLLGAELLQYELLTCSQSLLVKTEAWTGALGVIFDCLASVCDTLGF